MQRFLPFFTIFCALLLAACSKPQCPRNMVQHGIRCSLCPDGSEKKGNNCVTLDGGVIVEPVEGEDEDDAATDDELDADLDADQSDLDAASVSNAEAGMSPPDSGLLTREYALGVAGEACPSTLEQTLACEGHASRKILKCQGGSWQILQTCSTSERCDSRVGTEQGTCATIPAACVGKAAGDICDGTVRLTCGIDLVSVENHPCGEHSHCESATGASCACDTGYQSDGQGGCKNPDDCVADACKGGKCVDGLGDYSCNCDSGYAGTGTKKCTPVLYCPKDACTPGGTCVDTMNWSCTCNSGYSGTGTQACSNQNDCPANRCVAPNATCQDLVGSYKCNCNPGFSGMDCANDICNPNPCRNGGTCSRTGTLCSCLEGFSGTNCQTDACNPNPCLNGGTCSRTGNRCACPAGFSGPTCAVDSCNPNPCQHSGVCTRTSGVPSCNCNGTGYQGNQCETKIDPCNGTTNACGGSCMTPLAHQPDESCTNGLLGACARTGKYVCQGTTTTVCNAASATAGIEMCGDGVDNDCDGNVDEPDASNATTWYPDCDGDGFAASTTGSMRACAKPPKNGACLDWSAVQPLSGSAIDCDDMRSAYRPGAGFGLPSQGSTSHDLNCDGQIEKADSIAWQEVMDGPLVQHPRCPLTDSCGTCLQRNGGGSQGGGRWSQTVDMMTTPTTTQPRCSTTASDGFAYESAYAGLLYLACGGQSDGPYTYWFNSGIQLCR